MSDIDTANQLFLERKFNDSIQKYDKILEGDSKNLIALNNKGYALTKLKKFDAALECYNFSFYLVHSLCY